MTATEQTAMTLCNVDDRDSGGWGGWICWLYIWTAEVVFQAFCNVAYAVRDVRFFHSVATSVMRRQIYLPSPVSASGKWSPPNPVSSHRKRCRFSHLRVLTAECF